MVWHNPARIANAKCPFATGRYIQSFSHRYFAHCRCLGSLQCYRRLRFRASPGSSRYENGYPGLNNIRRGEFSVQELAEAKITLDQRVYADLPGVYAQSLGILAQRTDTPFPFTSI